MNTLVLHMITMNNFVFWTVCLAVVNIGLVVTTLLYRPNDNTKFVQIYHMVIVCISMSSFIYPAEQKSLFAEERIDETKQKDKQMRFQYSRIIPFVVDLILLWFVYTQIAAIVLIRTDLYHPHDDNTDNDIVLGISLACSVGILVLVYLTRKILRIAWLTASVTFVSFTIFSTFEFQWYIAILVVFIVIIIELLLWFIQKSMMSRFDLSAKLYSFVLALSAAFSLVVCYQGWIYWLEANIREYGILLASSLCAGFSRLVYIAFHKSYHCDGYTPIAEY
jgi:hypothetical protein